VQEAAATLKVNPETVRRHIAAGRLPAVRIGRRVRIEKAALEALAAPIAPRAVAPGSSPNSTSTGLRPPSRPSPLTEEQIRTRQQAIAGSKELQRRMLARRGGEPLPPSWPLIRVARDERSSQQ
jgi:excisionase family DNA binding protein